MKHVNLFDNCATRNEVYAVLQEHFERDDRRSGWLMKIAAVSLAAAFVGDAGSVWRNVGFCISAIAAFNSFVYWIDNSNRNWTMHLMDWIDHTKRLEGD